MRAVAIIGRPISAVGSCVSIASNKGDAEAFGLEAARAVEGLLGIDVAFDFSARQGPKAHTRGVDRIERDIAAPHAHRGAEHHGARGHRQQLRDGCVAMAGLAERRAVEVGDLVRPDHPGVGMGRGDGLGLRRAPAAGPAMPGVSPGAGVSSTSGRTTSKGRRRRPSSSRR
jgi:hypothetical protein